MAFDYSRAAATSKRLITHFGGVNSGVQLIRPAGDPAFNNTTDEMDIQSSTTDNVNAIKSKAVDGMVDGTVIEANMSVFLLDNVIVPSQDDKLVVDGIEHSIVRIIEIKPADIVVFYKLIVER